MRIFENKVGRPSKTLIKKRKVIVGILISILFLIMLFFLILLYGTIDNKASIFSKPLAVYTDNLLGNKATKGTNIKVSIKFLNTDSKTLYYEVTNELNGEKLLFNGNYCNLVPENNKTTFDFSLNDDKVQYKVTIYNNPVCTSKISTMKTKKYYIKSSNTKSNKKTITITKKDISMSRFASNWNIGLYATANVKLNSSSSSFSVKSSNAKVMRVKKINSNQYNIFAISPGTATITATSSSGSKVSYTYKVKDYEYLDNSRLKNGVVINKTYNGMKVVVENGCSNKVVNRYLKDINEIPSYATIPTKAVYLLTENTFNELVPNSENHAGQAVLGKMYIDIRCDSYYEFIVAHEIAHNLDYYYDLYTGNGYISNQDSYMKLFSKYNGKVLRNYSFTSNQEFFADSYSYYFHKYIAKTNTVKSGVGKSWKYNVEIKNEITKTINTIKDLDW